MSEASVFPSAEVDGFELGMFVSYDDCGDAWVQAPDGRCAGLVWETGTPEYFKVLFEPDEGRWGTYLVCVDAPMTTSDEAREYLLRLLPELQSRWVAASHPA